MWIRALRGERLTGKTRIVFMTGAQRLVNGQREVLDRVIGRYEGLAKRNGVESVDVIFDVFGPDRGQIEINPETLSERTEEMLADNPDMTEDELVDQLRAEGSIR